MKLKTIILSIVAFAVVYAGVELITFYGYSDNGNVILKWQTASETNLKHFEIEKQSTKGNFFYLATVDPRSDRNYEYIDQSAYKTADAIYSYRLKIIDNDNSVSYSNVYTVRHSGISSVKRTWGSIKALFR
jgi:hypothetical protein